MEVEVELVETGDKEVMVVVVVMVSLRTALPTSFRASLTSSALSTVDSMPVKMLCEQHTRGTVSAVDSLLNHSPPVAVRPTSSLYVPQVQGRGQGGCMRHSNHVEAAHLSVSIACLPPCLLALLAGWLAAAGLTMCSG